MVLCCQNHSDLLWEKIVLVIEKKFGSSRLKAENSQEQFIWTAIFKTEWLFNFLRFIRSYTLEQLEFKMEKSLGFRNLQEKIENKRSYFFLLMLGSALCIMSCNLVCSGVIMATTCFNESSSSLDCVNFINFWKKENIIFWKKICENTAVDYN